MGILTGGAMFGGPLGKPARNGTFKQSVMKIIMVGKNNQKVKDNIYISSKPCIKQQITACLQMKSQH